MTLYVWLRAESSRDCSGLLYICLDKEDVCPQDATFIDVTEIQL